MQVIINQVLYNTKTAKVLAVWQNTPDTGDFNCKIDNLFQTQSGNFFIHEEGGALTDRATVQLKSTGWGERIRPISPKEALEWCSAKDKVEVALHYCGILIQPA